MRRSPLRRPNCRRRVAEGTGFALALLALALAVHGPANGQPNKSIWTTVNVKEHKSSGGATLKLLPSGAINVEGKLPNRDTYTLEARTTLNKVTGLRVEALPFDGGKGPGRAANGNFILTDVRFLVDGKQVRFRKASADYSQGDSPPGNAIDNDLNTGWAIAGEFGKRHAVVCELNRPVETTGKSKLTIVLDCQNTNFDQCTLGRFRVSLTSDGDPHKEK